MGEDSRAVSVGLSRLGHRGLLDALGIKHWPEGSSRTWLHCIWHNDRDPSATLSPGPGGTLRLHCYPCKKTGDPLHLVAHARGLDVDRDHVEVLVEGARLANLYELEAALCEREGRPRPPLRPAPAPGVNNTPLGVNNAPPPAEYPPEAEVAALWAAALPLVDYRASGPDQVETIGPDREAYKMLRERGLSPEALVDLDLARVLTPETPLPRWASFKGKRPAPAPWTETGHRLVVPVYDAAGAMRAVRAWRVGPPRFEGEGEKKAKRLPPAGFTTKGLVLADRVGRQMLEEGRAPDWWPKGEPFRVVICEGEPDLLTVASHWNDASPCPDAVLGIPGSGAWTPAIAARIPDDAEVWIHTDLDGSGEGYAHAINAMLRDRCRVYRGEPGGAPA